jgi:small subunit ribosomal protein S21
MSTKLCGHSRGKCSAEAFFREMKRRRFYEKLSEKSNREKAEAIRRTHKLTRKKAQCEGLIAAPRGKKVLPPGRATGRSPFSAAGGVFASTVMDCSRWGTGGASDETLRQLCSLLVA